MITGLGNRPDTSAGPASLTQPPAETPRTMQEGRRSMRAALQTGAMNPASQEMLKALLPAPEIPISQRHCVRRGSPAPAGIGATGDQRGPWATWRAELKSAPVNSIVPATEPKPPGRPQAQHVSRTNRQRGVAHAYCGGRRNGARTCDHQRQEEDHASSHRIDPRGHACDRKDAQNGRVRAGLRPGAGSMRLRWW